VSTLYNIKTHTITAFRQCKTSIKATDPTKFLKYSGVVKIPGSQFVIRISTKTEQSVACKTFHPLKKFITIRQQLLRLSAQFVFELLLSHNGKNHSTKFPDMDDFHNLM